MYNTLSFCNNIDALMGALGVQHIPSEWRLFIDSSKSSIKAVLLHNGNLLPSIPIAYSENLRVSHETMVILLEHIKYDTYNWRIYGDLNVIGLLLGMQPGYTKYCCFICEWNSRALQSHYIQKDWPLRDELIPAKKSVSQNPLVDPKKVLLPPLHIKLGLIENFVKAMVKYNKEGEGFQYIKSKFPKLVMRS